MGMKSDWNPERGGFQEGWLGRGEGSKGSEFRRKMSGEGEVWLWSVYQQFTKICVVSF